MKTKYLPEFFFGIIFIIVGVFFKYFDLFIVPGLLFMIAGIFLLINVLIKQLKYPRSNENKNKEVKG